MYANEEIRKTAPQRGAPPGAPACARFFCIALLATLPATVLCEGLTPRSVLCEGLAPRLNYDRSRDGALAESTALRAYAAASNAFAQAATFGPLIESARISWLAPLPKGRGELFRLVLSRTTAPDGRILSLRAYTEPLRANLPAPARGSGSAASPTLVEIPLLHQTTQGTCAPYTVASLLQFYGIPCLPEQLEARAATTEASGTDVQRLLSIVSTDLLPGTGLSLHEHLGFGTDRFLRLLTEYNRQTDRRPNTPRLFWKPPDIHLDRAFSRADPALLHDVANRQPERKLFWKAVRRSIDAGHPLLWGVLLGTVAEPGLPATQSRNGHLRLIVGYRDSPQAILYSDPWGPAHAAKELPLEDAWTETMTLHSFQPK